MSAVAPPADPAASTPGPATLDVSSTARVPLSRLVRVELRKMVDTRAGMWLLIVIGVVTVVAVGIFGLAAPEGEKDFRSFLFFSGGPQGFLLPVMGILLVTQEWGQRTAMVTFTLEPHRGRVLLAKTIAALAIGFVAITLAFLVAVLATAVFGSENAFDTFDVSDIGNFALMQAVGILQGLAFGLVFLSSATAIVLYFVLPTLLGIIGEISRPFREAAVWFDLGTAQTPVFESPNLTGEQWAQLGVTIVIWVVVPFLVGTWRMLRAELK